MLLNPCHCHRPETVPECLALLEKFPQARILGGGTFLINQLKRQKRKGLKTPADIISLRRVKELKNISEPKGELLIGAMATFTDILRSPAVTRQCPPLQVVCRQLGTSQIRNMGTVGGNLCCRYPWTELGAVLTALAAECVFIKPDGRESVIPAETFFQQGAQASGLLHHLRIAVHSKLAFVYYRLAKTPPVDIPRLAIAICTENPDGHFHNPRVVLNTGVHFAQRIPNMEEHLQNQPFSAAAVNTALTAFDPQQFDKTADDYKRHMYIYGMKTCLEDICREESV